MALPNEYFDANSFHSLGSSSVIIFVIVQTIRYFLPQLGERASRIIVFILALLVVFVASDKSQSLESFLLILANTCLLFVSIIGIGNVTHHFFSRSNNKKYSKYKGLIFKLKPFFKPFY